MVTICLVLLVQDDPRMTLTIVAMVIIGREITISALREWMASIGSRAKVAVSMGGKIKTVLQMVGIGCMVYANDFLNLPIYDIGVVFLLLAAGMTLWSMVAYLRAAWPVIAESE
jgi:phosphatidylglycerophosphate synthase